MNELIEKFSRNVEFNASQEVRMLLNEEVYNKDGTIDLNNANSIALLRIVDYIYQNIPNIGNVINRNHYKFVIDEVDTKYVRFKIADIMGNILTTQVVYKCGTYDIICINDFGKPRDVEEDYKLLNDLNDDSGFPIPDEYKIKKPKDFSEEESICNAKADVESYRKSRELVRKEKEVIKSIEKNSDTEFYQSLANKLNGYNVRSINCVSELIIEKLENEHTGIINRCNEINDKLKSDVLDTEDIRYITTLLMEIELRNSETKCEVQRLITDRIMIL